MNMRLKLAEKVIDDLEGHQSYHALDKGKRTLFGVAERSHPEFIKKWWSDPYNPQAKVEAIAIMSKYGDETHNFDILARECPRLAYAMIAGAIHGVGNEHYTAVIQQALNIKADGIFGPKTFRAARKYGWLNCLEVLRDSLAYLIERRTKSVGEWARKGMRRRLEKVLIDPDPFFDSSFDGDKTVILAARKEAYSRGRYLAQRSPSTFAALSALLPTLTEKEEEVVGEHSRHAQNPLDNELTQQASEIVNTASAVRDTIMLLRSLGGLI